jgi:release factor glutamine methyltransferase
MPTTQIKMKNSITSHIDWGEGQLSQAGIENPKSEAELLLAEVLGVNRQELWINNNRVLKNNEILCWKEFIHRRAKHEPFAYIVGSKEFWSLDFKVNSHVLIPRPETEHLIDCLLDIASRFPSKDGVEILDIGTGSGIIAVVAAREISNSKVTAIDIKSETLEVAEENAGCLGVSERIQFFQSDLFENIKFNDVGKFDFILSNPPYIKSTDIENLMTEVRDHEPRVALDGGDSGLEFYERIIIGSGIWLKPEGHLILEIGVEQTEPIIKLLEMQGDFEFPQVKQDYSGRHRIISVQRKING